jgi:hypothetical protein
MRSRAKSKALFENNFQKYYQHTENRDNIINNQLLRYRPVTLRIRFMSSLLLLSLLHPYFLHCLLLGRFAALALVAVSSLVALAALVVAAIADFASLAVAAVAALVALASLAVTMVYALVCVAALVAVAFFAFTMAAICSALATSAFCFLLTYVSFLTWSMTSLLDLLDRSLTNTSEERKYGVFCKALLDLWDGGRAASILQSRMHELQQSSLCPTLVPYSTLFD